MSIQSGSREASLAGALGVDRSWAMFLLAAAALTIGFVVLQTVVGPSFLLPGSTLLYGGFLSVCTPDAEQAGMMASRMIAALAALGVAGLFAARIPARSAPDGYQVSGLKRRQAYGFVFLLAAGAVAVFLLPEDRRGDPLGCEHALRDQFQFWLGAVSAFGLAAGCKLFVDGLSARR